MSAFFNVAPGAGRGPRTRPFAAAGLALAFLAPSARAQTIAVLQGLDKITARVSTFDAPVDQAVRFGSLVIMVKACVKRPPEEPPETTAYLDIDEERRTGAAVEAKPVFSGWMFASSPAVSAMQDPIYDITVLDCKTAVTAAPSSGSSGK